jgi:hypothetical protein
MHSNTKLRKHQRKRAEMVLLEENQNMADRLKLMKIL